MGIDMSPTSLHTWITLIPSLSPLLFPSLLTHFSSLSPSLFLFILPSPLLSTTLFFCPTHFLPNSFSSGSRFCPNNMVSFLYDSPLSNTLTSELIRKVKRLPNVKEFYFSTRIGSHDLSLEHRHVSPFSLGTFGSVPRFPERQRSKLSADRRFPFRSVSQTL